MKNVRLLFFWIFFSRSEQMTNEPSIENTKYGGRKDRNDKYTEYKKFVFYAEHVT